MDRSSRPGAVARRLPGPLSVTRLGDVALASVWSFFATASVAATIDEAPTSSTLATVHHASSSMVLCLFAILFIVRPPAAVRAAGGLSMLVAIVGSWMMPVLIWLPLTWDANWLLGATTAGLIVAYLIVIWSLLTLRRSFSIFPEARALVRRGPYGLVRHPLYATYMVMYGMLLLPRLSPVAVLITGIGIACEVRRARDEERVLRAAFPDYGEYAAATPRFVPWVAPHSRRASRLRATGVAGKEHSMDAAHRAA